MSFGIRGNQKIFVTSSGNQPNYWSIDASQNIFNNNLSQRVGINNSNPPFQLSVVGTTSIQHSTSINLNPALDISSDLSSSNAPALRVISPDRTQDVSNIVQGGQGQIGVFSSNSFADISVNHGGGIVMGGNDGTTSYRTFGGIFGRKENNTFDNRRGYLQFLTRDGTSPGTNNLREKMRITSNGNVGIGTNNPSFNLDVSGGSIGNSSGNLTLNVNSSGAGGTLSLAGGTGLLSATSGGSSGQHLVITINGTQYKIALLS